MTDKQKNAMQSVADITTEDDDVLNKSTAISQLRFPHKISRGRIILRKGNIYVCSRDNQHYELLEYINESLEVMVRNIETLNTTIVSIHELENLKDEDNNHINVDLSAISDEYWEKAQAKYEAIRPLVTDSNDFSPLITIEQRAEQTGISARTLYRWINAYKSIGSIAGLVDRKRGWQEGSSRLTPEQDALIKRVINTFYLNNQRATMEKTYREVFRLCTEENIDKPTKKTIRLRIQQISEKEQLKKRGQKEKARNKFTPTPNQFPNADFPLSVVQIDHTPVDIILVDSKHRKPIGRPFLTLAIDVHSRMITGYYLSLDAPSVTSVAMCVARSILPKEQLLLDRQITDATWKVFGYPHKIHVDNAAEFRSHTFSKACEAHGISLEYRPVARPHYGGHIERLIGTHMEEIHGIKGTTFSNIKEKADYDSEKEASLTLEEFERWLLIFITKFYHKKIHSSLDRTPEHQWNIGIFGDKEIQGVGIPALPSDAKSLYIDFLPSFERTIQHFGVKVDGLRYYDSCLNMFINESNPQGNKKQFTFHRDPRDISKLWFYDPISKQHFPIHYANQNLPPMSIWEYKQARKAIKDSGIKFVNEQQVYEALTELREIVEASSATTKKARRQLQRQKSHHQSQKTLIKDDHDTSLLAEDLMTNDLSEKFGETPTPPIKTNVSKEPKFTSILTSNLSIDDNFSFGDID